MRLELLHAGLPVQRQLPITVQVSAFGDLVRQEAQLRDERRRSPYRGEGEGGRRAAMVLAVTWTLTRLWDAFVRGTRYRGADRTTWVGPDLILSRFADLRRILSA